MIKIGILTFHNVHNYGGVLQAYALQSFIKKNFNDIEVEVIDYRSKFIEDIYSFKKLLSKPHLIPIKAPILLKRGYYFKRFLNNIPLSQGCFYKKDIGKVNDIYHAFIVGSDQVWNHDLSEGDLTYLLDFAKDDLKFSYAASFGLGKISPKYMHDYKRLLSQFSMISVRENTGKELLENEFDIKNSSVNVDPTLLLTKEEWTSILSKKSRNKEKKYVLIYTIHYSDFLVNQAKAYAKNNGFEIVYVGTLKPIKDIRFIPATKIENFLDLFLNAQAIFTNSFHGVVFSTIFHKKMQIELPYKDGRNSRIENLATLCNIKSQITSDQELDTIDNHIDWEFVDSQIKNERKKSLEYLNEIIDYCNKHI